MVTCGPVQLEGFPLLFQELAGEFHFFRSDRTLISEPPGVGNLLRSRGC